MIDKTRYLSGSAFAIRLKISNEAVRKIKKELTLILFPPAKKPLIDIQGVKTLRYMSSREKKKKDDPAAFAANEKSIKRKGLKPEPPQQPPINFNDPDLEDDIQCSLKDKKTQVQIDEIVVKTEQKRGDLIRKAVVKKVFDRIHQIDQNQLKTLGVTAAPKISSIYNDGNKIRGDRILKELNKSGKLTITKILSILNSGEDERVSQTTQVLEDSIGDILVAIQREIEKFIKYTDEIGQNGTSGQVSA